MPSLKTVLPIAAFAVILMAAAWIKLLSAENEHLTDRVANLEKANQTMAYELAVNQAALSAREAERKRLANEASELKFKLGELYEHDKTASDWADAPCPPGVLECLLR